MPKRFKIKAKRTKQSIVSRLPLSKAGQKPKRDSNNGNTKNIGKVGKTYQNVYQA